MVLKAENPTVDFYISQNKWLAPDNGGAYLLSGVLLKVDGKVFEPDPQSIYLEMQHYSDAIGYENIPYKKCNEDSIKVFKYN